MLPLLDFVQFPYEKFEGIDGKMNYRPCLPITFSYKNNDIPIGSALVDTGSDFTILPLEIAHVLEIEVNLCLQSRQLRESPWKGLALPSGGMGLVKIPHMSFLHPPTPSSRGGRGEHTNIHPSPPREERIGVEERTKTKERRNGRTY